jgi:2-polyprenyl-3-methyl-5-hydroxy-6-metoxy-1,4-benzoquinol methylase
MAAHSVAEFFDSYSHDFDALYGNRSSFFNHWINTFLRKSIRLRFERSIEGCAPIEGKTVIDVGCGPGHYCIALAKRGAKEVLGIDFAKGMIDLAAENARRAGVIERCRFVNADFMASSFESRFDFSIVMGFMDYAPNPRRVIQKVMSITAEKAFFSFPAAGGVLAWQRKLRYRRRCELFLYPAVRLKELFADANPGKCKIERIGRDFFVTVSMK